MSDTLRHDERDPARPTFSEAAALIMTEPSEVARAVTAIGIEPIAPESGESRLAVADVFRVAIHVQRAALEEVGGGMLDWAEREHPEQAEAIRAEIDAFFATLPERKAADPDEFIAGLRAGLPPEAAEQAIAIYLGVRSHTE
jgi:hypothetical protein